MASLKEWLLVKILGYKATSQSYIKHLQKIGVCVGENVEIYRPRNTTIDVTAPHLLSIGSHVMITGPVTILTHDYGWSVLKRKYGCIAGNQRKTTIGSNVFIGWGATILGGSTIGDNVIIGANSVVSGNLESDGVYAGNPAKKIMTLEEYFQKRQEKQLIEAVSYVLNYAERWGVNPPAEELYEYFYLFANVNGSDWNDKFDAELKLMGNYEQSLQYLAENKPMFASYQEFLDYCDRQKS